MRNIAILIVFLTFAVFSIAFASNVPKQPNPETNISAPLSFTIDLSCTTRSGLGSPQVAFCIDMGSSMSSSNFNKAKNVAKAVARELGATPYFIYLGVVTFNDSVNVWDGDPFMPGNNFWNAPSTFTLDIDTARQHGGNDVPNAAWDAIWHAMEDYADWSITNAKVIVLFTDNSSCARDLRAGTSCCCDTSSSTYVDTIAHPFPAFNNPYQRAMNQDFVVFTVTKSPPDGPNSAQWDTLYRRIARATGGKHLDISMSANAIADTITQKIMGLLLSSTEIKLCITNTGPSASGAIRAQLVDPGKFDLLMGGRTQTFSSWPAGSTHCFRWRIHIQSGARDFEKCFSIFLSGLYNDTIHGCIQETTSTCLCSPPEAYLICPPAPSGGHIYTGCANQKITIRLSPTADVSTAVMTVNDTDFTFPTRMSIRGDTLIYSHPTSWVQGQNVNFALKAIGDGAGCYNIRPVFGSFIVDRQPPSLVQVWPPDSAVFRDTADISIRITVQDTPAMINPAASFFTANGVRIDYGDPRLTATFYRSRAEFTVSGTRSELGAATNDTLRLCIHIEDSVKSSIEGCHLCGPNVLTKCFTYFIFHTAPYPRLVFPPMNVVSSCSLQSVKWVVGGWADRSSAVIEVDDTTIVTSGYTWRGDTLIYIPSRNWDEGRHTVCLTRLRDTAGRLMVWEPICARFRTDLVPPTVLDKSPTGIISDTIVDIVVHVRDNVALDWSSAFLVVIDDTFRSSELIIAGDSAVFDMSSHGYHLPDSGNVRVCFNIDDSARVCGPNHREYCWTFSVYASPILVTPETPSGIIVSCPTYPPMWRFSRDPVCSTIVATINGVKYRWSDGYFVYSRRLLTYLPPTSWSHAESVVACLDSAFDIVGNPIYDTVCISFVVDLQGPEFSNNTPRDSTRQASPTIAVTIHDEPAGVDPDSIFMFINDSLVSATWSDPILSFDCAAAGMSFERGETVLVVVRARDRSQICEPNMNAIAWQFVRTPVGVSEEKGIKAGYSIDTKVMGNELIVNCVSTGEADLFIYDVMGRTIYRTSVAGKSTVKVPLANFGNGVYLVELKSGNNRILRKLMLFR